MSRTPSDLIGDTVAAWLTDVSEGSIKRGEFNIAHAREEACDRLGYAGPAAFTRLGALVLQRLAEEKT